MTLPTTHIHDDYHELLDFSTTQHDISETNGVE